MADLRLAIPIDGADFLSTCAEYQRSNTEVSLKTSEFQIPAELEVNCNDNSGSTSVTDSSNNSNSGISTVNTSTLSTSTAMVDKAFSFTGTQYIQFPYIAEYSSSSFSISIWVRPTALAINQSFISAWTETGDNRTFLLQTDGTTKEKIKIYTNTNGSAGGSLTVTTDSSYLSNDNWTHLVVTYATGGTLKVYVNGESVAYTGTVASNIYQINGPIQINGYSGTNRLGSFITDIIKYFTTELSQEAVDALYESGSPESEDASSYPTECTVNPLQVDSDSNSTTWDMSTFLTLVNPNGESGTVKFKYATDDTGNTIPDYADDDTAYSATWLTLAQLQAETDPTAGCFRIVMQITGNGAQDGTVTDSSIVATISTTGGSGEYSYTF